MYFMHVLLFLCECASCKLPIKGVGGLGGGGGRGYLNWRNPGKTTLPQ